VKDRVQLIETVLLSNSESELLYDWRFTANQFVLAPRPLIFKTRIFFSVTVLIKHPLWRENWSVIYNCCWPSPAHLFSGPSPVGLATIVYSLRFRLSFLSPPTTVRAMVEVFDPASTREHSQIESESYVTTDGQSASLSWCQAPIWALRLDFNYCLTFVGLLKWGVLSDEKTGL
jgi:hypothetical protein